MSENTGHKPVGIFVPAVGILGIVAIVMYMAYDRVSGMGRALHAPKGPAAEEAVLERIRPVGEVAIAGQDDDRQVTAAAADDEAAADQEVTADEAAVMDGEAVYQAACTACHGAGIAGAPATGDPAAWEPRLEQGMDTLVQHAIEGFQGDSGVMPPRGGNAKLTDEQVRDAVQYMVDALED